MPAIARKQGLPHSARRVRLSGSIIILLLLLIAACSSTTHGTIGAILGRGDSGRTYVRAAPEHLAAYRAGIRTGDELLFVDGHEVQGLTDEQLRQILEGGIGQEIQLTLARGQTEIVRVTLSRSRAEPYFYR